MGSFKQVTYRRTEGGHYIRRSEIVVPAYFTADGGYVAAEVTEAWENQVMLTDSDYQDAVEWVDDSSRPY